MPVSLRGTALLEFEPEGLKWVVLAPIGLTAYEGLAMACSPAEFISLAKKMPDKLVIGTNPAGSLPHITAKLFVDLTNTGITVVPYSTGGTADADPRYPGWTRPCGDRRIGEPI